MTTKLSTCIMALAVAMTTMGTAEARPQNGIAGLIIGAGSGALVGQAITRDVKGLIVGSVIGTTLGMLTDTRWAGNHAMIIGRRHQVPPASLVYYRNWDNRHNSWHLRKHRRHARRWHREPHQHRR